MDKSSRRLNCIMTLPSLNKRKLFQILKVLPLLCYKIYSSSQEEKMLSRICLSSWILLYKNMKKKKRASILMIISQVKTNLETLKLMLLTAIDLLLVRNKTLKRMNKLKTKMVLIKLKWFNQRKKVKRISQNQHLKATLLIGRNTFNSLNILLNNQKFQFFNHLFWI